MPGSTTIRELLVRIGINADQQAVKDFDASVTGLKERLGGLVTAAAAVGAAIAAAGAVVVGQVAATSAYAKEVERGATSLGLTTDAYQELRYATQKYGVEAQDVSAAFAKIAQQQQAVAEGSEQAAAMFGTLGIAAEDLAGASPDRVLRLIADGMASTTDTSTRLALANQLLGEQFGKKLMPLLVEGAAGFDALAAQAHDLGIVMEEDGIRTSAAFASKTSELASVMTGLRNAFSLAVTPALSALIDRFLAWYEANEDFIRLKVDEYATTIGAAFTAIGDAVGMVNDAIGGADGWAMLAGIVTGLTAAGGLALLAVKVIGVASALGSAVAAAAAFVGGGWVLVALLTAVVVVVGYVVGVLSALALSFGDVWTYLEGGDSLMGRLIERWKSAPGFLGAIARHLAAIGDLAAAVAYRAGTAWDALTAAIAPAIAMAMRFADTIGVSVMPILDVLADMLDTITAGMTALTTLIGGAGFVAPSAGAGIAPAPPSAAAAGLQAITSPFGASTAARASGSPYAGATGGAVSVMGDTITISGIGVTAKEVEDIIARKAAEKARLTAAAFAGAEV